MGREAEREVEGAEELLGGVLPGSRCETIVRPHVHAKHCSGAEMDETEIRLRRSRQQKDAGAEPKPSTCNATVCNTSHRRDLLSIPPRGDASVLTTVAYTTEYVGMSMNIIHLAWLRNVKLMRRGCSSNGSSLVSFVISCLNCV